MLKYLKLCAKIISYLFLIMILSGLFFYYGKDMMGILKKFNWGLLYFIIFLQIPMIAFGGLAFKMLVYSFDIKMRLQDWLGLSFIANFLNQLLPYRPGLAFRYFYMKQHYNLKMTNFIYVMLVYFLMTIMISCLSLLIGWGFGDIPKNFNTIIFFSCFFILLIVSLIIWVKIKIRSGIHFIHNVIRAFLIFINNPRIFYSALFSLFLVNLITVFIFYFIFIASNTPLPLADCFFLVGILTITMIFPITPGNIGILETLTGTLTQMFYDNFSIGFSVTALFRVTQWIPSIIFGTGFSLVLAGSLVPKLKQMKFGQRFNVD